MGPGRLWIEEELADSLRGGAGPPLTRWARQQVQPSGGADGAAGEHPPASPPRRRWEGGNRSLSSPPSLPLSGPRPGPPPAWVWEGSKALALTLAPTWGLCQSPPRPGPRGLALPSRWGSERGVTCPPLSAQPGSPPRPLLPHARTPPPSGGPCSADGRGLGLGAARPESLMQIEFDVNRGAGRGERGALRRLARSPTPQPPSDSWLTQGGDGFWGPSGPHTLPEPAAPRPRAEPAARTRSGLGRGRTHGVGAPTATRCRPCCFRRPWLLFKCWGDASGDTPPGHMPNPGCRDG